MNRITKIILGLFLFLQLTAFSQFAKQIPISNTGANSETYQSFAFDGAWCWLSDSISAYCKITEKCTYINWIDSYGNKLEGKYDHQNGKLESRKLNNKIIIKSGNYHNDKAQAKFVWDTANYPTGKQSIAYTKVMKDSIQIYCYTTFNGKKWKHFELINSGAELTKNQNDKNVNEPFFQGGMSIDKESPNTLYLSVKRDSVFEIEKWTQQAGKNKWKVELITKGSSKNNVRPIAVRGATKENHLQVVWMQNTIYQRQPTKTLENEKALENASISSIKCSILSPKITNPLDSAQIVAKMVQAADWQLANPDKTKRTDWLWGAFYVGLYELYNITNDQRYLTELLNVGQAAQWTPQRDYFNPDRLLIGDVWASLFDITNDSCMLTQTKNALDDHLTRGFDGINLKFDQKTNKQIFKWWTWADGLYMAPQTFVHFYNITGEKKYLDYMNTHYWITADYLYSKQDSLMYRDDSYFSKKSKNGKKVFWARGNGWVVGGLARLLDLMPKNYSERGKYETMYKEMMMKLISLQRPDGLWTVSLYDPEELSMSESSGSAFFTYALAWGINNGLIDSKFKPNTEKAWTSLTARINNQGRLGYVQKVAANPFPFFYYQWHVYATGTYLMASKEMIKLTK